MDLNQFTKAIPAKFSPAEKSQILEACHIAEEAHRGQTRANGQVYFTHCLGVGTILAEMDASPAMICAGILHDIILDSPLTLDDLHKTFNELTVSFVDGVSRITALPQIARADQHEEERTPLAKAPVATATGGDRSKSEISETLRKMLLAIGDDVRIVIIKLADRLHNMRTLSALPYDRQVYIGNETLEIFAPLANRLGIWQLKWELEDLGFRYAMPREYAEIAEQLAGRRNKRQDEIDEIIKALEDLLQRSDINAKVSGRPKHIYSIYRKMVRKEQSFDAIRDLRAVRLIVDDVETCYRVLGIVHMHYQPISGEFDDYIAAKKPNNYQSLHTSVVYSDGKPLEIQIRTWEMHQNAEYGIAAHWRYKEQGSNLSGSYEQKLNTMRSLLAWSQEVEDNQDAGIISHDRVYVLTPRGDVIDLPYGSTPIDLAYQVHTDIGHRCRGAKVNGKLVTLDYVLRTGEQVEILTANRGGPSRDWLNPNLGMIKSARSRQKIKLWFKQQDRGQNLEHGKLLVEKEFKRLGLLQMDLETFCVGFNVKTVDDLYIGIGCSDIPIGRLINRISELDRSQLNENELLLPEPVSKTQDEGSVQVMGLTGLKTVFARCCNPMPGDPIIGFVTRGRGASIHRSDCPNILRVKEPERLIQASWGKAEKLYPVPIQLTAYDRQGLMLDISSIISGEPVRLVDLSMFTRQNVVKVNLMLEVRSITELSRILARLENLPNVIEAIRVRPG